MDQKISQEQKLSLCAVGHDHGEKAACIKIPVRHSITRLLAQRRASVVPYIVRCIGNFGRGRVPVLHWLSTDSTAFPLQALGICVQSLQEQR